MDEDMQRTFTEEAIEITNKHIEKCSSHLVIREMQLILSKKY